jgi:hypothetical protein
MRGFNTLTVAGFRYGPLQEAQVSSFPKHFVTTVKNTGKHDPEPQMLDLQMPILRFIN